MTASLPPLNALAQDASCMEDYDPNAMSVAQARHFIQQFLNPLQAQESVALQSALGRVLASPVTSSIAVPQHNNSAMDGVALRHAEAGLALRIAGTAFAGRPFDGAIAEGSCIKIMTGAVVPDSMDTVVMQEHVQIQDGLVKVQKRPAIGSNVRLAGEDIQPGQTVLPQGHRIQAADMGLLASLGIAEVEVYRRLKVAFFSTGDELIGIGQPLQQGQIYDSNRYSLWGMCQALGVEITDLGRVGDDPALLEHTLLQAAANHDVVLTSGGVSVGEADNMKALLAKHGQVLFWKINMKPGRPLAYGKIGQAHYFGLPGNPVSAMVTFYQFVQAAIRQLMGETPQPQPCFTVTCVDAIKKAPGRTEFQRGILFEDGGEWKVRLTGAQGSGILSSMSQANCFVLLDADIGHLPAGTPVKVQPFQGVC